MLRPTSPSTRAALEAATEKYQAALDVALDYLASRGISKATAESHRLGVVIDPMPGHERMRGRLAIPSLGKDDAVSGMRFRSLDGSEPKVLGLPGVDLRLFNVRALHLAGESIWICEGETDVMSLTECGLHAVGFPGVKSLKPHHVRLFAGYSRVYVAGDGDEPGREFAQKLSREIDTSIVVPMPDGADCNSLLVEHGPDVLRSMCQ